MLTCTFLLLWARQQSLAGIPVVPYCDDTNRPCFRSASGLNGGHRHRWTSSEDVKLVEALQQHGLHADAGRLPLDRNGVVVGFAGRRDVYPPQAHGGVQINVLWRRGYTA